MSLSSSSRSSSPSKTSQSSSPSKTSESSENTIELGTMWGLDIPITQMMDMIRILASRNVSQRSSEIEWIKGWQKVFTNLVNNLYVADNTQEIYKTTSYIPVYRHDYPEYMSVDSKEKLSMDNLWKNVDMDNNFWGPFAFSSGKYSVSLPDDDNILESEIFIQSQLFTITGLPLSVKIFRKPSLYSSVEKNHWHCGVSLSGYYHDLTSSSLDPINSKLSQSTCVVEEKCTSWDARRENCEQTRALEDIYDAISYMLNLTREESVIKTMLTTRNN